MRMIFFFVESTVSYLVSSYGVLQMQYSLVSFLLSFVLVVEIIFFFLDFVAVSLSSSRFRLCAEVTVV